jgi:predicted transposase YdaD
MQESVVYQKIIQRGIEQGELTMVLRQLNRRLGNVNPELQTKIESLSLSKVEELGDALLDFATEADLVNWLERH